MEKVSISRDSVINEKMAAVIENVEKVIIGKRQSIELLLVAMLTGGHVLIEDVPGWARPRWFPRSLIPVRESLTGCS